MKNYWLAPIAGATVLVCGTAAAGQEVATPQDESGVEDIIVTARKKAERLQDAPISITAMSADAMARTGVTSIADIAKRTPGLQIAQLGDRKLSPTSLRGISNSGTTAGSDPAVGYYIDEVFVGQGPGASLDLYDIERVEILRGPQGTLYGRNTIGGVISITTKKPTEELSGSVETSIGNYGARRIAGSLSGPIIPGSVYAKIAAIKTRREGYEHNATLDRDANGEDAWSMRGQLLFDFSPDTNLLLTADYRKEHNQPLMFETLRYVEGSLFTRLLDARGFARNADPWDRRVQADINSEERLKSWGAAATFKTRIGGLGITSITAYRKHDYFIRADTDKSPLQMLYDGDPEKAWQFSEEVRADFSTGPIDWIAGLYYFRKTSNNQSFAEVGQDLAGAVGVPQWDGLIVGTDGQLKTTSKAAFLSATWQLDDRLDVTLGGRYTRDSKEIDFTQSDPTGLIFGGNAAVKARGTWGQFTPNANIRFRFAPDVLGYLTVSKGFKSGGFNDGLGNGHDIGFDPETLWNYEAGIKASLFERKLVINTALYYMKWDNIQISRDNPKTAAYDPIIFNGGAAHSKGIEVEISARPTERLTLGGNFSIVKARYEAGILPDGSAPLGRIGNTPAYTGLMSAEYRMPVNRIGDLSFYVEYVLRGRNSLTIENNRDSQVPAYGLLNARVTLASDNSRWSIALWGKNLTDKTYVQSLYDLSAIDFAAQKSIMLGNPRTYGVELKLSL